MRLPSDQALQSWRARESNPPAVELARTGPDQITPRPPDGEPRWLRGTADRRR